MAATSFHIALCLSMVVSFSSVYQGSEARSLLSVPVIPVLSEGTIYATPPPPELPGTEPVPELPPLLKPTQPEIPAKLPPFPEFPKQGIVPPELPELPKPILPELPNYPKLILPELPKLGEEPVPLPTLPIPKTTELEFPKIPFPATLPKPILEAIPSIPAVAKDLP